MSSIFNNRLNKLYTSISKAGYDGFYITNLTNIRYLTGFTGSAGLLILYNHESFFFTDGRYIQQSQEQIHDSKITIISSGYFDSIKEQKIFNEDNLNIGFESQHMSFSYYEALSKSLPNISLIPTESIVENIAAVKDSTEIDSLKTAIEITDEVFTKILPEIKEGVTEKYIATRISYLFKMNGAEGDSYESIIAGGPRSALPHARPTDREFIKGDFIVMDFGALYNGYHADMTRTVVIGKASDKHKEIYNIVLESQLAGIKKAKAGITGAEVDNACRTVINQAGYGDKFIHSTGHGIGLEVHTYPRVSSINKKALLENYVITIEPGIYLEGWGGVRIEDDIVIKRDGCDILNKTSRELIIL